MIWLKLISTPSVSLKGIINHLLIFPEEEIRGKNMPIDHEVRPSNFIYTLGQWACETLSVGSAVLNIKNKMKPSQCGLVTECKPGNQVAMG